MRAALGIVTVGVLAGELFAPYASVPGRVLCAAAIAPVLVWPLRRRSRGLVPAAVAVAAAALGVWRMAPITTPVLPPAHVARLALPVHATLTARIVAPPDERADRTVLLVEAERVGSEPACGRVRLSVRHPSRAWAYGERLAVVTTLRRPRNFANPGSFDYVAHLARRGVLVTGFVWDGGSVERLPGRAHGVRAVLERWRARVAARIEATVTSPEGAVLRALVVGDEGKVPDDLRDAFTRAGLVHVLSVSGLHIALVAAGGLMLVRALLSRSERLLLHVDVARVAAALALGPVAVYTALAGLQVATVRSALMVAATVVAAQLGRRADVLRTLALAALVLALGWPGAPLEISFQLSFASVLAIVGGTRWLAPGEGAGVSGWTSRAARRVREAVAVSVAALVGTAPLTAFHFHQVSLVGVVANPVAIPIFGAAVVGPGLVGALLEPIAPTAAGALFTVAGLVLRPGVALVRLFGTPAWAAIDVPYPTVVELGLLYGLLLAVVAPSRPRVRRALLVVALAGLAVDVGWWIHERVGRSTLRVTFLDVGQGDAAVVELPGGAVVVVDAGGFPAGDFDTGAAVVGPFLWTRKIMHPDAVAMTHAHPDHSGGVPYLLAHLRPREFWWTGVPAAGRSWDDLQAAIARSRVDVRVLADGAQSLAGGSLVLHPPDAGPRSLNESSLTLRFGLGDVGVLLTGDIESGAEARLVERPDRLRTAVLKVPHHGSRTSSTPAFVDAVAPAVAVISVGADNRYGLPSAEVERRYRARGICVLRTDRCGAITVETDGTALRVVTARPGCGCGPMFRIKPPA